MEIPLAHTGSAGLSVLLGSMNSSGRLIDLPLDKVVRNDAQPRTIFDVDAISALAESIASQGIIQPIAVRQLSEGRFEIIAGERRWLAAQRAGLSSIPAVVHDVDERESLVLALAENLVREDLNAMETARAYASLMDEFDMKVADLARAMGKSRPSVSNTLRLLELPDDVVQMIESKALSEGHGRALLTTTDRQLQRVWARRAVDQRLSVRELEKRVRAGNSLGNAGSSRGASKWNRVPSVELQDQVERIAEKGLGVRAKIRLADDGAKLEFFCEHSDQLFEMLDKLELALAT
jgi:ParB family chromosome partitioning protein